MLATLAELRYHVIGTSIVTDDKTNNAPGRIGRSFELFDAGLVGSGSIVLAYDSLEENTVKWLVGGMIEEVGRRGLKGMFGTFRIFWVGLEVGC